MTTRSESRGLLANLTRTRTFRVAATLVLIGFAGEAWYLHLNANPRVTIPPPAPLPNPNAFDDLARLDAHKVEPRYDIWKPTSEIPVDPPAENAPLRLPLPANKRPKMVTHQNNDADRREALAKAESVLAAFRAALSTHDYRALAPRGEKQADLNALGGFRSLARTLAFASRMHEQAGDYAGATRSALEGIRFGMIVPKGGRLITRLNGIAIEAIVRKRLWGLVDHLSAEQATDTARRLQEIERLRTPLAESLTEEKWVAAAEVCRLFSRGTTFGTYKTLRSFAGGTSNFDGAGIKSGETSQEQRQAERAEVLRAWCELLTHSKQNIVDDDMRMLDSCIAASRLPYAALRPPILEAHDPINRYLFNLQDVYRVAMLREAEDRMSNNMLIVAFALRAYRLQQSAYPENLDALKRSGLLREIPDDPFARTPGTPFCYRRDADHFVLYSVGIDGVDDGGLPIDTVSSTGWHRSEMLSTDKGDWVYSVNTPQGNE